MKRTAVSIALWVATLGAVGSMQVLQPTRGSAARADSDRDADGVIDALDNCLVHRNSDQRDTNRDGIGNRCDADLDNDGVVDHEDLRILLGRSSSRDADFNGDGTTDYRDLAILLSLFGRPPGPRLDSDGDGRAEFEDPCPGTRRGSAAVVPGCSSVDLVRQPESVTGPLAGILESISDQLTGRGDLMAAREAVDSARNDFDNATRVIRAGNLCAGASSMATGVAHLERASTEVETAIQHLPPAAPPDRIEPFDVSESELVQTGLRLSHSWIVLAHDRTVVIRDAVATSCVEARPFVESAVIRRVLDGQRQLEMTDGRLFVLADPVHLDGAVFDGRRVRVGGMALGNGTGVVTELGPAGTQPIGPPSPSAACVDLRVAPVQLFPPYAEGPFLLHDPEGYRRNVGGYWLEQGMGLAAARTCLPGPPTQLRYSLELLIAYQDRVTKLPVGPVVLAADLAVADDPVILPSRIDPAATATLTVTSRAHICLTPSFCSDPTVLEVRTFDLTVFSRGALCTAAYNRTVFDVDDQVPADFKSALVAGFMVSAASDSQPVFEADGYATPLALFSTFPTVVTITAGIGFALHNHDFHPIHQFAPGDLGLPAMVAGLTTGVNHAAGLKWPRTRGTRNGHPFQYSCRLPEVVRDAVNLCGASTDAFYRLPFPPDDLGWTQSQANLSSGTHKNGYAYDMVADENTPILAARAGRVIAVEESNSLGFGDPGCENWETACPANKLTVWHQDGSIAEYVHSPKDGILVEVGDVVRRGEEAAKVGRTGRASGAHLHIGTATAPRWDSTIKNILHLYEAVDPTDSSVTLTCYEPKNGDILRSNNTPWP